MWKFFLKLIQTQSGYSSKRFTVLIALALFVVITVASLCGLTTSDIIIESTVCLILGGGVTGLFDKMKGGNNAV